MRRPALVLALMLTMLGSLGGPPAARAAGKLLDHEVLPAPSAGGCSLSQFTNVGQAFDPPFAIPDDNQALVDVGSIPTDADGTQVLEAMVQIYIAHTWMGDLALRLEYVDCATGDVERAVDLLCRPRGTNLLTPAPCGAGTSAGCSGNLGSVATSSPPPAPVSYLFSDSAATRLGDGDCPSVAPSGCYLPAPGNAMSTFIGLPLGGCWKLQVGDWAPADVGVIESWAVWTRRGPLVATHATSWGEVKTIYR